MQLHDFRSMLDSADDKSEVVIVFADWLESLDLGPYRELRELATSPNVLWIQMLQSKLEKDSWRAIGWSLLAMAAKIAANVELEIDPVKRTISSSDESVPSSSWEQRLINDMIGTVGQCDDAPTCSRLFEQLMIIDQASIKVGKENAMNDLAVWISGLLALRLSIDWIDSQEKA